MDNNTSGWGNVGENWESTPSLSPFASFRISERFPSRINFFETLGDFNIRPIEVNLKKADGLWQAYKICSPVLSIVNRLAEASMNGQWKVIDVKSGDDLTETHKELVTKLNKPNPLQTYKDFLSMLEIYKRVFGEVYIYANVPAGKEFAKDAVSYWIIRPSNVTINYGKKLYNAMELKQVIESYDIEYKIGDVSKKIKAANPMHMLHISDTSEKLLDSDPMEGGVSRLTGLEWDIKNILQAQEAIYALNLDRGAQGIISSDKRDAVGYQPFTQKESRELHQRWREAYGMKVKQNKVMITDAAIKYTPIGFNVKDLMLFEGVRENVMRITDAYNYPFDLLASEKGKTAADKRTSMKSLYQDNIIPQTDRFTEKLSDWLGLDIQRERIIIDYSHLDIFQEGNVERNTAQRHLAQAMHILYNGAVITMEEFRRIMGFPPERPEGTLRTEQEALGVAQPARGDVRITTS